MMKSKLVNLQYNPETNELIYNGFVIKQQCYIAGNTFTGQYVAKSWIAEHIDGKDAPIHDCTDLTDVIQTIDARLVFNAAWNGLKK